MFSWYLSCIFRCNVVSHRVSPGAAVTHSVKPETNTKHPQPDHLLFLWGSFGLSVSIKRALHQIDLDADGDITYRVLSLSIRHSDLAINTL